MISAIFWMYQNPTRNQDFLSLLPCRYSLSWTRVFRHALRTKCLYSELFWSTFFRHFPTFGLNTVYLSVFNPNVGKCGKNADQNNSKCGHFFPAWCSCILNWFPVICQSALFPLSWVNRVNSFWSWIDQNLERKKIWTEIKSGGSQWFQKVTLTYSWIMLKHDQTGIENLVVWTPQDFKERSKDISLYVTVHWITYISGLVLVDNTKKLGKHTK